MPASLSVHSSPYPLLGLSSEFTKYRSSSRPWSTHAGSCFDPFHAATSAGAKSDVRSIYWLVALSTQHHPRWPTDAPLYPRVREVASQARTSARTARFFMARTRLDGPDMLS